MRTDGIPPKATAGTRRSRGSPASWHLGILRPVPLSFAHQRKQTPHSRPSRLRGPAPLAATYQRLKSKREPVLNQAVDHALHTWVICF